MPANLQGGYEFTMKAGLPILVEVCMCDELQGDEPWWCPRHGLMKDIDINVAWAAGFIDGEGYISVNRIFPSDGNGYKKIYHRIMLRVTNTDIKSLERLREIFGYGSIFKQGDSSRNYQTWAWCCNSLSAASVLRQTLPYMVTKRNEAELALDFQALVDITKGSRKRRGGHHAGFASLSDEIIAQRDAYYWALREAKSEGKEVLR